MYDTSSSAGFKIVAPSTQGTNGAAAVSNLRGSRIVAIGTSAGGLEALEKFFGSVPVDTGLAYVVVQHLDPDHDPAIVELLQRVTRVKVCQVRDRTRVAPNRVYVIAPNRELSIEQGILHLKPMSAPRGQQLTIDIFFRSMAEDQRDQAVAVILSGMGTDGTLGAGSIKENSGLVLVQEPTSAKFDSMPRSAIDAGFADIVAAPQDLPARIVSAIQAITEAKHAEVEVPETIDSCLQQTIALLRAHTGQDFSHYKATTLHRRIERRMGIHRLPTISAYLLQLKESPQELEILFKELLIGVTAFFRDPAVWEDLLQALQKRLGQAQPGKHIFRVWIPGCSTGEEAYSMAMICDEAIEAYKPLGEWKVQVFATDLDKDAIEKARRGYFAENIASDVSPARLNRFFNKIGDGYRVRREIRESVVFAVQNLIMDPPFTKLDLLSCRNLLIYLSPEVQKKLIPLFHYSLQPGGILLLGTAETIGSFSDLFLQLPGKSRLYLRRERSGLKTVHFPISASNLHNLNDPTPPLPKPQKTLQSQAERAILQRYAPAAVVVTEQGDIVYVSGKTGEFLEPAAGKANWNIFAMIREGLRLEMSRGFKRALDKNKPVLLPALKVTADENSASVDVSIERLQDVESFDGLLIVVFIPAQPAEVATVSHRGRSGKTPSTLARLAKEHQQATDEIRRLRDEMQTSQQDLRSSNEELQSTNEELQSTNEELTTSREEMQSLNEELQTVNGELQAKLDDLSRSSDDMANLLNSTRIATVFLDGQLRVRRFTPQATNIIKLIDSDIGRPLSDLSSDLVHDGLQIDLQSVLTTHQAIEKQVTTRDSRWFSINVMPYRTVNGRIDGVVITFTDITAAKLLETKLRAESQVTKNPAQHSPINQAWNTHTNK